MFDTATAFFARQHVIKDQMNAIVGSIVVNRVHTAVIDFKYFAILHIDALAANTKPDFVVGDNRQVHAVRVRQRKVQVLVLCDAAASLESYQCGAYEKAKPMLLNDLLALVGFLVMGSCHSQCGAQRSLENLQCWQAGWMTVTKIGIIDQADRLRVAMNIVALLPQREVVPLLFGQLRYELFQLRYIDLADMYEVACEVHGMNVGLSIRMSLQS